ncbi:MAG: hypothetical protein ACOCWJ_04670, partial [Verrucomicrobiota bacterium]
QRRGGKYHSLFVDELCWGGFEGYPQMLDPESLFLDAGWAVLSSVDAAETKRFAGDATPWDGGQADLCGVVVCGCDGLEYLFVANFGKTERPLELPSSWIGVGAAPGLGPLASGQARLYRKK